MKRYEVNNKLIKQNPEIEKGITEKAIRQFIDINKIKKKIFEEKDRIKLADYNKSEKIIQEIENKSQEKSRE